MAQAILDSRSGVRVTIRAVHWLQEELLEGQTFVPLRFGARLGENQFQLIAFLQDQFGPSFRADANPIDSRRR
jgi:hypothetical protein